MSANDVIQTPRGLVMVNINGKAELKWSTYFRPMWNKRYSDAQRFIDSEVLRLCEPYIPLLTGMLIMSGMYGTEVGKGEVAWIAPYARAQYYSSRKPGRQTGPLRGPHWFDRMKNVHGAKIVEKSRRLAGGGAK